MPSGRAEAGIIRQRIIAGISVSDEGTMSMIVSMAMTVSLAMAVTVSMSVAMRVRVAGSRAHPSILL